MSQVGNQYNEDDVVIAYVFPALIFTLLTSSHCSLFGLTGSGKTSFVNLASGSNMTVGHGVDACTDVVERSLPFQLEGRQITLVDTPGFDDTTKSDAEILKIISEYLAKT